MTPDELVRRQAAAAAAAIATVLVILLLMKVTVEELADELRIERDRRREVEAGLKTRGEQLDGALEKIHELGADG